MATHQAIAATGQALRTLLSESCPRDEFPAAQFALYQASNFLSPMDEGISLYLFRVTINGTRRNQPPKIGPDGIRYRPPLPLDLYFLLTAWAQDPAQQYQLLGWAMRMLEDNPILPSSYLNQHAARETFRPPETVEFICDPVSLQDMYNIWEIAKHRQQLSMVYVARMVCIDSEIPIQQAVDVQTRAFKFEKEVEV
jgi:hypothetical protein